MKLNLVARIKPAEGEHIAQFGDARLVKKLNGKFGLLGGTTEDRAAAQESCSLFLREVTINK